MNNTKRNEKINELESIETVLGITKAEYAAEKLLEQYEKTGLRTEALFDSLRDTHSYYKREPKSSLHSLQS